LSQQATQIIDLVDIVSKRPSGELYHLYKMQQNFSWNSSYRYYI